MITLNLPGIFGIAAAALALLLFVKVALSPATDRTGKHLLLVFLAGLFGMAVNSLYFFLGMHQIWPHASYLWVFLMTWIGPAFWFYTARVLGLGLVPWAWPSLWHWLPGIVLQAGLVPYLLMPGQQKIDFLTSSANGRWTFLGVYLFIYLQMAAYVLLCQRALRRHRVQIAATAEKEELRVDIAWINVVSYGFAGFLVLDGVLPHLRLTAPGMSLTMAMAMYLFVIAVVFHATTLGRVYPFVSAKARSDPKYVNSSLRDDTARHYLGKLESLMREERAYLDSELSLDKLAAAVRIHPHYLSQILNDHLGKNFYDYINAQRIAHARSLLLEQPGLPVVDVAVACGYNNKNSFYNSFRRFVGMTPTEFRQQGTKTASANPEQG